MRACIQHAHLFTCAHVCQFVHLFVCIFIRFCMRLFTHPCAIIHSCIYVYINSFTHSLGHPCHSGLPGHWPTVPFLPSSFHAPLLAADSGLPRSFCRLHSCLSYVFGDRVSRSSGCPPACYVVNDDFEIPIPLPLSRALT